MVSAYLRSQIPMVLKRLTVTTSIALLICTLCLILGPGAGFSNPVVPYDRGATSDMPSAAARIVNLYSVPVPGGCRYSFDVEVFPTCWKPVYHLRIEGLTETVIDPASWPADWVAEKTPSGVKSAGSILFSASDQPIMPGEILRGFAVVSYSAEAAFRWYPADGEGILIGKLTRIELGCATATEPSSWGLIKSIYR
jgi:hypothetical protein